MHNIFAKTAFTLCTLTQLTACMLNPVSTTRQQLIEWNNQPLTIQASYNELMAHHLHITFNDQPVIDTPLGNPVFPEYSEENYKKSITFLPLTGTWNNLPVNVACDKGPWNKLLNHPKCHIKIDQQPIAHFDFNLH